MSHYFCQFLKIAFSLLISFNTQSLFSKQLKILIIETYFPPLTSTAALNQITGLIDRGYSVDIFAKKKGDMKWAHPDIKKYKLLEHTYFEKLPKNLKQYDIILCQFGYRATDFLRWKRGKINKIITCFRGADLTREIKKFPRRYRRLFRVGDYFLPVCDYFKKRLRYLGCDPKKIKVLHSAINCEQFRFRERTLQDGEPVKFVSVCRLTEKKGLEYAIKAIAKVLQSYTNIEYSIVGFGDQKKELKRLIDKLGVQKNVKILGRATQEEVAAILDQSHIFILPCCTANSGDQEGIPNAIKEAMAMGLPIISTYHAGIPELVENEKSGFLVVEKDTNALANKIKYLIAHPEMWSSMGAAGRKKVLEEYDKEKLADKLDTILQKVAKMETCRQNLNHSKKTIYRRKNIQNN